MSAADDAEVIGWIEEMRQDVAAGPEAYRPGAFWDDLITRNTEMIATEGIGNLKRTVSNNYFNWLVEAIRDPQMISALRRWARRPNLAVFRTSIEPMTGLRRTDRDSAFELKGKPAFIYRFFVASLWDLARREDSRGLTQRLSEPEAGNPVRVRRDGRLISQDLANSIIEFAYVDREAPLAHGARVAELGAGYGRLAHVYAEAGAAYCIFDIPPALAVSQWYLRDVLGSERVIVFRPDATFEEIEPQLVAGTVGFFTPAQLELFPDGFFALTQTISTLPEMPREQAMFYLSLLLAKSSDRFFLKQWLSWRNDADDVELHEADYVPPAPWRVAARREDPVQPAFFDQIWRRG